SYPQPNSPATASTSAGSSATRNGSPSAVSGSFSPCPVSTHTHRLRRSTSPACTAARSPATLAADAGSQNTPSRRATSRYASRISASETVRNEPADSRTAATAVSQLAGRPMRIAVATVSGWATGSPRTSGAAPSAWTPSIRGSLVLEPRSAYRRNPSQYAVMLPPLPTGSATTSGASPSSSQISYAAVAWPSTRYGFTELTSAAG